MNNKLRRIFCPTLEEQEEDRKQLLEIHRELAKEKGCSTCAYIRHVIDYPGFVTGEAFECATGLECDTVLHTVKNCINWVDSESPEGKQIKIQNSKVRTETRVEMTEDLHLMITPLCDRDCKYCCNKQYEVNKIPIVTEQELRRIERVFLTGGEPFIYSSPNEIAWYLKHHYPNIKMIAAYTNAEALYTYRYNGGSVEWLDGITISIKSKEDYIAFKHFVKKNGELKDMSSIWIYVFPGFEEIKCPKNMKKIKREWQERFVPAPNSIFRRL